VSLKKIPEQILFSEFFLFGLVAQRRIDIEGEDLVLEFRFISNANLYQINRGKASHYCYSDDGFPSLKFRDLTHDYLWNTIFYLDQTEGPAIVKGEINTWFFVSRGPCLPDPIPVDCLELAENMPFISSP